MTRLTMKSDTGMCIYVIPRMESILGTASVFANFAVGCGIEEVKSQKSYRFSEAWLK